MRVEGVTFVEAEIKKISKKDFLDQTLNVFFLDRDRNKRKKMLSDIYDRITADTTN